MTTETVLKDDEIDRLRRQAPETEWGYDLNGFARDIERAVLQSPEVQAWKKDAERWRYFMFLLDNMGDDDDPNAPGFPYKLHEAFQEGSARTIEAIDAAMEKQQ